MDTKQQDMSKLSIEQLIEEGYDIEDIINIAKTEQNRQNEEEREEALSGIREDVASNIVDYVAILTGDTPTREERIELENIVAQSFKKAEAQLKEFSKLKEVKIDKSDDEQIRDFINNLKKKSQFFIW